MTRRHVARHLGAILVALPLLLFGTPASLDAHSELETSTPNDGATVAGSPPEISGTYSEPMKSDGSSLQLLDASSNVIATGAVDPTDDMRMAIAPVPSLPPGAYTVHSTTISAADGDLDRTTWTFTVTAAAASGAVPSPIATPSDTDGGSSTPTTAATAKAPSPDPTPAPSAAPGPGSTAGDVVLPILAAGAILAVAAISFGRRGRRAPDA